MAQAPEIASDDTPFPDVPIWHLLPERLAAIARLRGLQPAPAARARVLELGAASGQNLIPLAERYPQATFVGIDASPRQNAMARRAAAELGLENVEFRRADILDLGEELGTFDYILAHGLYSWVRAEVREKLLAVCGRHLAPQGVAYVNYKTYPGWHVHQLLGDLMRYDARGAATKAEELTRARGTLEFLDAALLGERSFETLIRSELAPLAQLDEVTLRHDHLREFSHAVYFRQFAESAAEQGLQPLGDCVLGIRLWDNLGPPVEERLAAITSDPIAREQYRDVIRNRAYRQTLLCRSELELNRVPKPEALRELYLEARLTSENFPVDLRSAAAERFTADSGLRVATAVPLAKAALAHLGQIWPNAIKFDALVVAAMAAWRAAAPESPEIPASEVVRLEDNLWQCSAGGVINVHSEPQLFVTQISERPLASPWARWQAEHGDVVTNRKHRAVRLEFMDRQVLRLLDGWHDMASIIDELAELAAQGQVGIRDTSGQIQTPDRIRQAFEAWLPQSLKLLATNAYLIG